MKIMEEKEYKGYKYVAVEHDYSNERNPHYWWCGYVKLQKNSQYTNYDFDDIPVDCYGGLTFKGHILRMSAGEWIGFDTNHFMDGLDVKNQEFIEKEFKNIIEQLIELEEK